MADNFMFNISENPTPQIPKQAPSSKKPLKKQKRAAAGDCDFKFNVEEPKAKALVVRRRPDPGAKEQTTVQTSPTITSASMLAPATATAAAPAPAPDGDLMLNVTTAPKTGVFSKKELKKALKAKKRKENPNKQPRAGDLFKAQMDEEYKRKRSAEQQLPTDEKSEQKEPEAESKPKNAVPAVNKFRTKKVGLFDQSDVAALKEIGQRAVKPIHETIFSDSKVESLGLHAHAVKNLMDLLSITQLTTVQQKAIPQILAGKDVLVRSQTGSGKTLAYALPIVERLQSQQPHIQRTDGILALVIVPTRELVMQTYELFQKLLKPYTWIVSGAMMGGESRKSEKARLRKGINILLGTPGRLVDHLLHTSSFKLSKLQFIVLDEADRLLELGYERQVKQLVEAIDEQREKEEPKPTAAMQRLLLSATLTAQVQQLAGLALKEPLYIDNSDEAADAALKGTNGYNKEVIEAQQEDTLGEYVEDVTGVLSIPENLQLSYLVVPPKLRLVTISALLAKEMIDNPKDFKAIVFMSTTEMVNFHHDVLNEALTRRVLDEDDEQPEEPDDDKTTETPLLKGLRFFKLHGSMTQTERQGVFRGFRDCASCVLLATDVVGRGIDVPDIKVVVQYTPPQTTADFVHRVGRAARAGRKGRAVLFLAPSEVNYVRHLESKRIRIKQGNMYSHLEALLSVDHEARNVQQGASNLQHKFQKLLEEDRELRSKSCKAFVSWLKFYSTFPKELKPMFNIRMAHMGHFAKSFALKQAPTKFVNQFLSPKTPPPTNRLTYTERDPEKMKEEKRNKKRLYTTTVSGEVRLPQDQSKQQQSPQSNADRKQRSENVGKSSFMKSLNKSRVLNISEFDSGLPEVPATKRRKQT